MSEFRPYSEVEAERERYPLGAPKPYRPEHENILPPGYDPFAPPGTFRSADRVRSSGSWTIRTTFFAILITVLAAAGAALFPNEERVLWVLGLLLLFGGGYGVLLGLLSLRWPTASGIISRSEVVASRGTYTSWRVELEYDFSVNGRTYFGKLISFKAKVFSNPKAAQRFIGNYPIGKQVNVHYLPNDPRHSVLVPGPTLMTAFLFLAGLNIVLLMSLQYLRA